MSIRRLSAASVSVDGLVHRSTVSEVYHGCFGPAPHVAIKSRLVRSPSGSSNRDGGGAEEGVLQYEADVLSQLSDCAQIISLVGMSEKVPGPLDQPSTLLSLVLEWSSFGSVADMLQSRNSGGAMSSRFRTYLEDSPPLLIILQWLKDIYSAVDHLGRCNLVHGRINPSHILIFEGMTAKLTGFCGAVKVDPSSRTVSQASPALSINMDKLFHFISPQIDQQGSEYWLRNIHFVAPELLVESIIDLPGNISPAVDVFSLARVTAQLVHERCPLTRSVSSGAQTDANASSIKTARQRLVDEVVGPGELSEPLERPKISDLYRRLQSIASALEIASASTTDEMLAALPPPVPLAATKLPAPGLPASPLEQEEDSSPHNKKVAASPHADSAAVPAPPVPASTHVPTTAKPASGLGSLRNALRGRQTTRYVCSDDTDKRVSAHSSRIKCMHILQNGRIAAGDGMGVIKIWPAPTEVAAYYSSGNTWKDAGPVLEMQEHRGELVTALSSLLISSDVPGQPDVEYLLSASEDCTAKMWSVQTGECQRSFVHTHAVYSVAGLPDGMLASGSWIGTIHIWDALSGDVLLTLQDHVKAVSALTWVAQKGWLLSAGVDKVLRVWDIASQSCLQRLSGHTDAISFIVQVPTSHNQAEKEKVKESTTAPSADCVCVVTGGGDKTLRLWDVAAGVCLRVFTGHRNWVLGATVVPFAPGQNGILAGDMTGAIKLWNASTGACEQTQENAHREMVFFLVTLADGRVLSSSGDGSIHLWSPSSPAESMPSMSV